MKRNVVIRPSHELLPFLRRFCPSFSSSLPRQHIIFDIPQHVWRRLTQPKTMRNIGIFSCIVQSCKYTDPVYWGIEFKELMVNLKCENSINLALLFLLCNTLQCKHITPLNIHSSPSALDYVYCLCALSVCFSLTYNNHHNRQSG